MAGNATLHSVVSSTVWWSVTGQCQNVVCVRADSAVVLKMFKYTCAECSGA